MLNILNCVKCPLVNFRNLAICVCLLIYCCTQHNCNNRFTDRGSILGPAANKPTVLLYHWAVTEPLPHQTDCTSTYIWLQFYYTTELWLNPSLIRQTVRQPTSDYSSVIPLSCDWTPPSSDRLYVNLHLTTVLLYHWAVTEPLPHQTDCTSTYIWLQFFYTTELWLNPSLIRQTVRQPTSDYSSVIPLSCDWTPPSSDRLYVNLHLTTVLLYHWAVTEPLPHQTGCTSTYIWLQFFYTTELWLNPSLIRQTVRQPTSDYSSIIPLSCDWTPPSSDRLYVNLHLTTVLLYHWAVTEPLPHQTGCTSTYIWLQFCYTTELWLNPSLIRQAVCQPTSDYSSVIPLSCDWTPPSSDRLYVNLHLTTVLLYHWAVTEPLPHQTDCTSTYIWLQFCYTTELWLNPSLIRQAVRQPTSDYSSVIPLSCD